MNSKNRTARTGFAAFTLAAALTAAAAPASAEITLTPAEAPTAVAGTTTGSGTGSWNPYTGSANSPVVPYISPGSASVMGNLLDAITILLGGRPCHGCANDPA